MPHPTFRVPTLGTARIPSPIAQLEGRSFFRNDLHILRNPHITPGGEPPDVADSFEVAGPRAQIYFEPHTTKAAIVTCGGLCPGLNAVIRSLVLQLWHRYGVQDIVGIRHGLRGFVGDANPIVLRPETVSSIHERGGTILGTSRGSPPVEAIVDQLSRSGVRVVFLIGGDGTMRAADAICTELKKRGLKIAVVGIPKTIDNDIPFVKKSFGFESAVQVACEAVKAGHEEALAQHNGIGLVKLMGRHSGYITANVTIATGDVNFCLVPEVRFALEGPGGLFSQIKHRLQHSKHAVIAVAEGAGQYFFEQAELERDASGNVKLKDIGVYLRDRISAYLRSEGMDFSLKYIDPSYLIRATPAIPSDQLFCDKLARNAVHAAMAGKTGLLIGYWHGRVTHVPLGALQGRRQTIDPAGELWFNVLESTGQRDTLLTKADERI